MRKEEEEAYKNKGKGQPARRKQFQNEPADEYGESLTHPPCAKDRRYILLVGDPDAGPTIVQVSIEGAPNLQRNQDHWEERN